MRVIHVLNWVGEVNASLHYAQGITLKSILEAQRYKPPGMELAVVGVGYVDEEPAEWMDTGVFTHTHHLRRSVCDLVSFPHQRRLPLIADIMACALRYEADYYIYSNIDIALQPHYYSFVGALMAKSYDGIIINRRRIPFVRARYAELSALATHHGATHPGFDNFVMHCAVAKRLVLGTICVGVPFIGVAMAHNIFAFAQRPCYVFCEDVTFHLGMEIMATRDKPYYWHNRRQFFGVVRAALWSYLMPQNLPYAHMNWIWRYWKWARNPSLFVWMNTRLLWREYIKIKKTTTQKN